MYYGNIHIDETVRRRRKGELLVEEKEREKVDWHATTNKLDWEWIRKQAEKLKVGESKEFEEDVP